MKKTEAKKRFNLKNFGQVDLEEPKVTNSPQNAVTNDTKFVDRNVIGPAP